MNILPSAADTSAFGWENFFVLVFAAVIPAIAVFIWAIYFRKKRRRRRRRHEVSLDSPMAQTNGLPPIRERENAPGEPKS
jgi:hypothetical protein